MARNSKSSTKTKTKSKSSAKRGPVRNTAIPKTSAAASKKPIVITQELISERAYFIHLSGTGGSESDNWHRAERELRTRR